MKSDCLLGRKRAIPLCKNKQNCPANTKNKLSNHNFVVVVASSWRLLRVFVAHCLSRLLDSVVSLNSRTLQLDDLFCLPMYKQKTTTTRTWQNREFSLGDSKSDPQTTKSGNMCPACCWLPSRGRVRRRVQCRARGHYEGSGTGQSGDGGMLPSSLRCSWLGWEQCDSGRTCWRARPAGWIGGHSDGWSLGRPRTKDGARLGRWRRAVFAGVMWRPWFRRPAVERVSDGCRWRGWDEWRGSERCAILVGSVQCKRPDKRGTMLSWYLLESG